MRSRQGKQGQVVHKTAPESHTSSLSLSYVHCTDHKSYFYSGCCGILSFFFSIFSDREDHLSFSPSLACLTNILTLSSTIFSFSSCGESTGTATDGSSWAPPSGSGRCTRDSSLKCQFQVALNVYLLGLKIKIFLFFMQYSPIRFSPSSYQIDRGEYFLFTIFYLSIFFYLENLDKWERLTVADALEAVNFEVSFYFLRCFQIFASACPKNISIENLVPTYQETRTVGMRYRPKKRKSAIQ